MADELPEDDLQERLVVSFEIIAKALVGLHEEAKRAGIRYWPEPKQQKESVVTRIETEEDLAKKSLGASDGPIQDWLNIDESDDDYIGEREREWRRTHPAKEEKIPTPRAQSAIKEDTGTTGSHKAENKA